MSDQITPLLVDPAAFCTQFSDNRSLAGEVQALVAAFLLRMGALVAGVQVDKTHFAVLHLPANSQLRNGVLPHWSPATLHSSPCDTDSSDDELVLPAVDQHTSMAPAAATAANHLTDFACLQSGPVGLHEADDPSD